MGKGIIQVFINETIAEACEKWKERTGEDISEAVIEVIKSRDTEIAEKAKKAALGAIDAEIEEIVKDWKKLEEVVEKKVEGVDRKTKKK